MALTTTQVNTAFLAALARPAEGSAAAWGSASLSLDTLLDSIFIAENTDGDFVEYLYQNILGRASDAEGKAFWNTLLTTSSKEAVLAQFKAAVLAAGQADPSNADYQAFIAQNKAFVTDLYTNLLGRSDAASADAEGVDFWTNALTAGTSRGDLLAQFTAAVLANPNSDDAQALSAKMNVANAITAKFNNFNADVTADEKKVALDALKATMTEVVAGSTAEDFQERIDTFAGNYQNRVAQVFTTKTDDQLDSSEATASTVFSGNVNLIDSTKGTIQTTDSVAGNSNYTDTLRVSVTSDSANKDFSLTSALPTSVSSIEKLIVTAGAANVSGTLSGSNYGESATITSTGDVDLKIAGNQKELKVTAGEKKDAAITVESGSLNNYVGSSAKDTINVKSGASTKTIDTGAGKDVVTIASGASIQNEGSIKLGAGDDELTISADLKLATTGTVLNKISLDGGEGSKDVLNITTDITAVNSITGFETISASGATISADAANSLTSGTKLADKSSLTVDMEGKNSLNLKNLKVGNDTDNKLGTATVGIENVAKGEVTLTTTTNNAIVETITLKTTATDGTTGPVTIKGIGAAKLGENGKKADDSSGDKLAIDGMTTASSFEHIKNYDKISGALDTSKVYYINTAISSADDLSSKSTVLSFLNNATLTGSDKVLVALNNSAQNKSYVFELKAGTGTGNAITRDDITLKAIVDNAINSKDVVSSGVIEFVADTEERDVKPSGGDTVNVLTFDKTKATVTLSDASYNGSALDNTKTAVAINGVDAAITLDGDKGSIAKAHVFAQKAEAVVTDSASLGSSGIVLHIGGKATKADASTVEKTAITDGIKLDSTLLNSAVDTSVVVNTDSAINFDATSDLGGHTLDVTGADANITINTALTTFDTTTLTGIFTSGKAADTKDTLNVKIGTVTASGKTVNLTDAKDVITFTAATTTANKYTIADFKAGDLLKGAKTLLAGTTDGTWTKATVQESTGTTNIETGKAYVVELAGALSTVDFSKIFANQTGGTGSVSALVAVKGTDGLSFYKVTDDKSASSALTNEDYVKLTGVLDAITADTIDGIIAL